MIENEFWEARPDGEVVHSLLYGVCIFFKYNVIIKYITEESPLCFHSLCTPPVSQILIRTIHVFMNHEDYLGPAIYVRDYWLFERLLFSSCPQKLVSKCIMDEGLQGS